MTTVSDTPDYILHRQNYLPIAIAKTRQKMEELKAEAKAYGMEFLLEGPRPEPRPRAMISAARPRQSLKRLQYHGRECLNKDQVHAIRHGKYSDLAGYIVADIYDVSSSTISNVRRYRTYRDLP